MPSHFCARPSAGASAADRRAASRPSRTRPSRVASPRACLDVADARVAPLHGRVELRRRARRVAERHEELLEVARGVRRVERRDGIRFFRGRLGLDGAERHAKVGVGRDARGVAGRAPRGGRRRPGLGLEGHGQAAIREVADLAADDVLEERRGLVARGVQQRGEGRRAALRRRCGRWCVCGRSLASEEAAGEGHAPQGADDRVGLGARAACVCVLPQGRAEGRRDGADRDEAD